MSPIMLTSPGWPDHNYPNTIVCRYLLVAEQGHRITVTFLDFSIEEDWDTLICGNGHNFNDKIVTLSG